VVFDEREQEMTAIFGGVIESCEDVGDFTDSDPANHTDEPDGVITVAYECVVDDEELELMLRTTAAHHFNWIAPDLSPGDHEIKVYAEITTNDDLDNDTVPGEAVAMYGKRTLSIEEVQATNQDGGIIQF
jgi:hypothetical protein